MSNIFNHSYGVEKKLALSNIWAIGDSVISVKCDTIRRRFLAAVGARTLS
jgi:hypothetical protein